MERNYANFVENRRTMGTNGDNKSSELNRLTNRELVENAVGRDSLTPLEVELTLRLEAFIELHGDYLTEV